MECVLFCLVVLFFSLFALYLWKKAKQTPCKQGKPLPGPTLIEGLRVFFKHSGSNTLHLCLPEWAEKYGEIMHISLLFRKVVFINDSDTFRRLVRDAELKAFTNDRVPTFIGDTYFHGSKDIGFTKNNFGLQQQRTIFQKVLKMYGESRGEFEQVLTTLLQKKAEKLGTMEAVNLPGFLKNVTASIFCSIFTGSSSDENWKSSMIVEFSNVLHNLFEIEAKLQSFPFLHFIPGLKYRKLHKAMEAAIKNYHDAFYFAMKNTYSPDQRRGLIDELIFTQEDWAKQNHKFQFDDDILKLIMLDFAGAGYRTTSAFLTGLFLLLIKHQDIQARIYEEIQSVIGDSTPAFQHKQNMMYTEAVLLEVLRLNSITPLLIPHFINEDIVFDGYFIPKGSILFMNAWYNHHREDIWEDPYTFKPERFLDANGQLFDSNHPLRQRLIPFGSGLRVCAGETFVRLRTFLITVSLLKQFQFVPDENNPLPSADPRHWRDIAAICPNDFTCKVKHRHD